MSRSRGFTFIELVVAIVFAGILLSITVRSFGAVRTSFAAQQGRQVFQSMHARARAHAIETGSETRLYVDVDADSMAVVRNGAVVETVYLRTELGVDIVGTTLTLCMTPRGFADTNCNSFNSPTVLRFEAGDDSEPVLLLPLGQILEPSFYSFGT